LDVLARFAPASFATIKGAGRYRSARCPFHEDKKPSFWIDTELQIWGCHRCGIKGDVINLFSKLAGKTNGEAIKELYFQIQNGGLK
jgi:DNA primase